MISLSSIREAPTVYQQVHESVFRSWLILQKVEELLNRGWPTDAILEIIEDCLAAPSKEWNGPVSQSAFCHGDDT